MDGTRRSSSRRDFLKLAGASSMAALLAACGGGTPAAAPTAAPAAGGGSGAPVGDTTATLTIFDFGGDADKKIYADAHARFKQKFPNVMIADNFTPVTTWSEYSNKITTQMAGGQSPDIINIAIEGARLLVKKGLLRPLDEFSASDPSAKELADDVDPALSAPFKIDGKTWYMPHSWNNMVIYYNTKMFKDAGIDAPKPDWTWDDFLGIAKKLTTGSGADQVFGFGIPNFNFGLQPWMLTNGTTQLNADWTDSNLNDPKVIEAMTFVNDLVNVHKVSPAVEGANNDQLFASGKIAMGGWGHWPIQGFLTNNFRDFDVQYWPRKETQTHVFGVGGWGIAKDSKNAPLAWELIKELTSKTTLQASADAGVAIPARRSVAASAGFLKFPPNSKIYYDTLKDTKPVASPANFNEVETIFMRHMGEILSGAATPEAGMKAAHEELSAAMAKLKAG